MKETSYYEVSHASWQKTTTVKRVSVGRKHRKLPSMQSSLKTYTALKKMKRIGYLFDKVCDLENLRLAEINAGTGKGSRNEVAQFRACLEQNLADIRAQLVNKTYHTFYVSNILGLAG